MLRRYAEEIGRVPEGIKKLRGIGQDLCLYGNSDYAREMLERLNKWDIGIKAVLVSKEYAHEHTFEGYPVYEAEEYLKKCKEVANESKSE